MGPAVCPRCHSDSVTTKLLTIGEHRSEEEQIEREGTNRREQVYADEIKSEFLDETHPCYITGIWCNQCSIGFIPDHYLKNPKRGQGNGYTYLGFWLNQNR